jgi:hypothetical protein
LASAFNPLALRLSTSELVLGNDKKIEVQKEANIILVLIKEGINKYL